VQSRGASKYFEVNETTGVIRLKHPVDFEEDAAFELIVEARDSPLDSPPLTAYARLTCRLIDVNDNRPEITLTFLGSLHKNRSTTDGFKYDVYVREHTRDNQFIAHVNILDRDTDQHAMFVWQVLVNDAPINTSHVFKLIKLDEARSSFTINVASAAHLDRELHEYFNISVQAWDTSPLLKSVFNFTVRLLDVNDHRPVFEHAVYNLSIYENNELFERIFKFNANDADVDAQNSRVSFFFAGTHFLYAFFEP
jgi:hypothetical protein